MAIKENGALSTLSCFNHIPLAVYASYSLIAETRFHYTSLLQYLSWCKIVRVGTCILPASYTLIIAEKPKAAQRIAQALGGERARRCVAWKVPYYIFYRGSKAFVVGSTVGHLFGLTTSDHGFPVFSYEWKPLWTIEKESTYTKPYYRLLETLSSRALLFINACDYDIEGSVIGYLVIKQFGDLRRARRMRFSTLAPNDIRRAFERLEPLDWPLIEAGLARHELDWIWGINVSRALMEAVRTVTGRSIKLSAGRVQSPTLMEALRRDIKRKLFVPLPYFNVEAIVEVNGQEYKLSFGNYEERLRAIEVANKLRSAGYIIVTRIDHARRVLNPPPPFNLGDLQMEAARVYGYGPAKTQEIAEKLYLEALISYPRTNSQRIPPSIDVRQILEGLQAHHAYSGLVRKLLATIPNPRPRQGSKDDPAHPAIHPTGIIPRGRLSRDEERIYDLVVRRFLASMAPAAIIEKTNLTLRAPGTTLTTKLQIMRIINKGWLDYYPYINISSMPAVPLSPGDKLKLLRVTIRKNYTKPPEPYTKATLVKWMESKGIGTEATRARIVEILFQRRYLVSKGKGGIEVTDLGYTVASVLERYFPQLTSVDLTKYFERKLENIRRGAESRVTVIAEAKRVLSKLMKEYKTLHMRKAGLDIARSLGIISVRRPCLICGRESVENNAFCQFHLKAFKKLKSAYNEWGRRLGKIGFYEYLGYISKISSSGAWIRDVALFLLKHKDYVAYVGDS